MNQKDLECFSKHQYLFLKLKNGFHYHGRIEKLDEKTLVIKDKYNHTVVLNLEVLEHVAEISELRGRGGTDDSD